MPLIRSLLPYKYCGFLPPQESFTPRRAVPAISFILFFIPSIIHVNSCKNSGDSALDILVGRATRHPEFEQPKEGYTQGPLAARHSHEPPPRQVGFLFRRASAPICSRLEIGLPCSNKTQTDQASYREPLPIIRLGIVSAWYPLLTQATLSLLSNILPNLLPPFNTPFPPRPGNLLPFFPVTYSGPGVDLFDSLLRLNRWELRPWTSVTRLQLVSS